MEIKKIAIGNDHAGFDLKKKVLDYFKEKGIETVDYGCYSNESVDYPDFAHPVSESVVKGENELGILLCGSGNGINMTANKHHGVRSALCWKAEIAELARLHNDANILVMPARYIEEHEALKTLETFISTDFEGGRHAKRVEKINKM